MELAGTIVNGEVRLDHPANLPDGTRVVFLLDDEDDIPPPAATETYAQYIAGLRKSITETEEGHPGLSIEEVMANLDAELLAMESVVKE